MSQKKSKAGNRHNDGSNQEIIMSETEASADPTEVTTQRLAFDSDKDIPQFLKKDRAKKVEPEEEDNEDLEPETISPISVDNSTENEDMENLGLGGPAVNPAVNPANLQDLAEMSIEQLKAQQAEIDRKISEKQTAEKQAVISQIAQVMKDYNIPVEELVEALGGIKFRRKGTKAKAKYRDPATGITWSGRGKEPAWIKGVADRTPFEI
jgi:DNA-binding protein H-NS